MKQDIFCLDIPNQIPNITMSDNNELFDENIYNLSINQNKQFSPKTDFFSINNSNFINSQGDLKSKYKTESDKEKDIKLNFDIHNINNNINNYCCFNSNINELFDNTNFIRKSNLSNNICNCTFCKNSQCISFNDSINEIPYEENFSKTAYNYENNIFNSDESNKYVNIFNENNKTNSLSNNNNNKIEISKNYININSDSENNIINLNKNIDKINYIERKEKSNNESIGSDLSNNMSKAIINLGSKRKIKKIRRKENKVNPIIEYGHPIKIKYKTMKQKLNIHKKLDLECRTDSLIFIYSISNLKKILTKILSKKNIKDKIYFHRIQNLYKNSILSLQHREYAQDITGYKLI